VVPSHGFRTGSSTLPHLHQLLPGLVSGRAEGRQAIWPDGQRKGSSESGHDTGAANAARQGGESQASEIRLRDPNRDRSGRPSGASDGMTKKGLGTSRVPSSLSQPLLRPFAVAGRMGDNHPFRFIHADEVARCHVACGPRACWMIDASLALVLPDRPAALEHPVREGRAGIPGTTRAQLAAALRDELERELRPHGLVAREPRYRALVHQFAVDATEWSVLGALRCADYRSQAWRHGLPLLAPSLLTDATGWPPRAERRLIQCTHRLPGQCTGNVVIGQSPAGP
jgi:hypothetical protein